MKLRHTILIGCGTLIGLFFMVMAAAFIFLLTGPEGGVRLPNEMELYAQEYLTEHKTLEDTEELLAYYDITISLDGTIAAMITTKRVIYHINGKNISIDLGDIEDIHHRREDFIGHIFEITPKSGQTIKIEISPLNQGETFKNILMSEWKKHKKPSKE